VTPLSLLLAASASAAPLNPADFPSLGTLSVANGGALTIDTDTLALTSGALSVTGVARSQTSTQDAAGAPEVAVFTFDTVSIGKPVALTVRGARALALLSKDSLAIAGTLSFSGGAGIASMSGAGRLSSGDGGSGGNGRNMPGLAGTGAGAGGGGDAATNAVPGLGGGGGSAGPGGALEPSPPNGTAGAALAAPPLFLLGGGGGGGGGHRTVIATGCEFPGGGGGAGGGAVELGAIGEITITDPIVADGGAGGASNGGAGGGGGGGSLLVHSNKNISILGTGALYARAGSSSSILSGGSGGRIAVLGLSEYRVGSTLPLVDANGPAGALHPGTVVFGVWSFVVPAMQSAQLGAPYVPMGFTAGRAEIQILRDVVVQSGGTLTLAASQAIPSASNLRLERDGTFRMGELVNTVASLNGEGTVDLGTGALIIDGSASSSFQGTTTGNGQIIKSGSGTLSSSGTLAHSGATTLTAGTLEISGRVTASPILIRGGTLQGSGTLAKVTVSGGRLTATPAGVLSVADLVMLSGGTLAAPADGSPAVRVTGSATLGGSLVVGAMGPGPLTIIDNRGTGPVSGQFGSVRAPSGSAAVVNYAGGDGNDVTVELVPAGSTATGCASTTPRGPSAPLVPILIGLGALLLGLARRAKTTT
jgi:autotransporter-associated beta strand protein